jgi:alkylresorcinol/alkylpyrone synthase
MFGRTPHSVTVPSPRLLGLATAVPPHRLGQADIAARARSYYAGGPSLAIEHMMPVFDNAGIDNRYSVVPVDWYYEPHGWAERNALYLKHAADLLAQAADNCLVRAGLTAADIDAIVVVSTTGIATPSLDAVLMDRLGLRRDIRRLPIFGLGCAGGVLGLARAADLARAAPESRVLLLVVELCALSFRKNDRSASNLVAAALFGDGAAAAILSCRGNGPAFGAAGEHTWPASLDVMGWDVTDDGLKAIFSRDIPTLIRDRLRPVADAFLASQGLGVGDIDHFVCHPGGAKVVTALAEAFDIGAVDLTEARAILRDYGNMSAATLLFVLERTLGRGAQGKMLLTAMGPGFTAGFQLLDA